ncbi:U1 small nuclear ribonucleo 70 kDa-like, partial [Micractinium conductrix]
GDPFKTLFVSRLSFDVTERKLRREFEEYGPIKRIRLVHDKNSGVARPSKPRGYAFVEFEHKNDMKQAYKMADGRKIENKRVLVDVERGRTVPTWRPRRLGGGKGGESRVVPRPPKSIKKQFLARLMERALAEKQRAERQETEKEREREPRDRSRERAALERSKDRSRDREEGERKQERSRSRDRRPRSRDRDYERRGSGKRERDERYDDGDRDRRYSSSAKRPRERDL